MSIVMQQDNVFLLLCVAFALNHQLQLIMKNVTVTCTVYHDNTQGLFYTNSLTYEQKYSQHQLGFELLLGV
jgi:hypothetical protein